MQNHRLLPFIVSTLLIVTGIGCAEERTYDISVKNNSSKPITLALARDDKADSEIWTTPEQVAEKGAPAGKQWGLGVVPPGKTVSADKIVGKFHEGAKAWIRIYLGDLTVGEMLKLPLGNQDRQDIPLQTGDNQIVVKDAGNHIQADRVGN